jgi:hypothetical protein
MRRVFCVEVAADNIFLGLNNVVPQGLAHFPGHDACRIAGIGRQHVCGLHQRATFSKRGVPPGK